MTRIDGMSVFPIALQPYLETFRFVGTENQKNPRVRKIFVRNSRKWVRQFYGRLEFLLSFCRKTLHVHKIPRFRGGGFWVLGGGGGSADFILWARGFF